MITKNKLEKIFTGLLICTTLSCGVFTSNIVKNKITTYKEDKAFSQDMAKMFAEIDAEMSAANPNKQQTPDYTFNNMGVTNNNYKIENLSTNTDQYILISEFAYIRVYLHYKGDVRSVEVWKNITGQWEYHNGYDLRN